MNDHFKTLQEAIFLQTGGYVPAWPAQLEVELGDLLLLNPAGGLLKLGNLLDPFFDSKKEVEISSSSKDERNKSWNLQQGVRQSYTAETASETAGALLSLEFSNPGDYVFSANIRERRSIVNFMDIRFKLLQELVTEIFSFRELYVVTSTAVAKASSLLVATHQAARAVLSIPAAKQGGYTFADLLKSGIEAEITALEAVDPAYFNEGAELSFFRAMKLEASFSGKDKVRKYVQENLPKSMQSYVEEIINIAPTQLLPSVNVYPAIAQELFEFRPLNVQDVRLF